ncbi:MAG: hypothetical protein ACR5LG_00150 [Sodalis sp. (in: enterobacteria)]|uniref:hypothetical protein n=1 Tax=Sodalis sp. (in: enterobacteria) TaxID=1898979 RepID=UPI003F2AF039
MTGSVRSWKPHKHALTLKTQQLHRSIAYAVAHDGAAYTGLGPDGLQRYRAALGYPADDNTLPCPRPPVNLLVLPPMSPHRLPPVKGLGPEALLAPRQRLRGLVSDPASPAAGDKRFL